MPLRLWCAAQECAQVTAAGMRIYRCGMTPKGRLVLVGGAKGDWLAQTVTLHT